MFSGQQYLCGPTRASILPPSGFINEPFAVNAGYMEKELPTIEKQSLQPDVYREGNDSAGAE